jgi:nitroreductase / dihydropteridine reductase
MSSFLSQLSWRFATKRFDMSKPVAETDLEKIFEAIRMAPTSSGMQPFHVYVVHSTEIKEKLYPASNQQLQVKEAPYLLVFCARLDIIDRVDTYIETISKGDKTEKEKFKMFRQTRRQSLGSKNQADLLMWSSRQAYIALGFGLAACAELEIDSCPMEGFDKDKVTEVLNLPPHMKPLVYLAIGYRAESPSRPKFRFSKEELFTFI